MSCDPNHGQPDMNSDFSGRSRRFRYKGVEYKWKASDHIKNNLYVSHVVIIIPQILNLTHLRSAWTLTILFGANGIMKRTSYA